MQEGDFVAWDLDPDNGITAIGIVRQLDGDPPDAAMVEEVLAFQHWLWGGSNVKRGERHSIAVTALRSCPRIYRSICSRYA